LGNGRYGYVLENPKTKEFFLLKTSSSNTKPVYRYYNPSNGDHLLTTDFNELNGTSGKHGYKYEFIIGYAYRNYTGGTNTPLLRYYNRVTGDHLYTINNQELGTGNNNPWVFEGEIGYAIPK